MTSVRARGVVLGVLFAVLLFTGGWWFVRSAPAETAEPRLKSWQASAAELLPDLPRQPPADTIVLVGDTSTQRTEAVTGGSYALSMICLGARGKVRVRLSSTGNDSGRAVPCTQSPQSVTLRVGLADHFFMEVSAETDGGTAVFRWRLAREQSF